MDKHVFRLLYTSLMIPHMDIVARANINLGGQSEFCPNDEHDLFVTRPRQGETNNNELVKCLFVLPFARK